MRQQDRREPPSRPAIPVALYALIMVILTLRGSLAVGTVPIWVIALAAGSSVAVAAASAYSERDGFKSLALCLGACVLALLLARVNLASGELFLEEMSSSSVSGWELEVTSDPLPTRYGLRCRAKARRTSAVPGDVWLTGSELPSRGNVVRAVGRFKPSGDDEFGAINRQQGIWGSVSVVYVLDTKQLTGIRAFPLAIRSAARTAIAPERSAERSVLAGCLLADRSELSARNLDDLFSCCGVAHLIAVSGAHISVVAAIVSALLEHGRFRPSVRLVLILATSGVFVLVCGAPASAVRAWCMSASASCAQLVGRRSDATSAVCLTGIAMSLINPGVTGQLGFLLSVTCVLSLTLFGSYAAYALDAVMPSLALPRFLTSEQRIQSRKAYRSAKRSLAASVVCQIASSPLTIPVFARFSLVGPLTALVVTTPITCMMGLGLAGVMLSWAGTVGNMLFACADICAHVALVCLNQIARLPLASLPLEVGEPQVWVLTVACATLLLIFWPRLSPHALRLAMGTVALVVCVVLVRWRYAAPARICVLDVGQGDAILIQDGASAILVDTGPDGSCATALIRNHVLHLDAVVITHLHDDHYGGLDELLGTLRIERVLVAEGVAKNVQGELLDTVRATTGHQPAEISCGDTFVVGRFRLQMVSPRRLVDGDENADSIMLVVSFSSSGRELTGLLTGDAEREELETLIRKGAVGDIDFLKVGHHGSEISITQEEADYLRPELAVASAGINNDYGHPTDECIEILEDAGSRFLCTKDVGDVEIRPSREGLRYTTQHP